MYVGCVQVCADEGAMLNLGKIAAALARAAEERAAAAVGEDHRGEGEQDWDGE